MTLALHFSQIYKVLGLIRIRRNFLMHVFSHLLWYCIVQNFGNKKVRRIGTIGSLAEKL